MAQVWARAVVVWALTAILLSFLASADQLFDYSPLSLELELKNKFSILGAKSDASVDSVTALLSWFPEDDYRQKVEIVTTEPGSSFIDGKGFEFTWEHPSKGDFEIIQRSKLVSSADFVQVKRKVLFPMRNIEAGLAAYLAPGEIIDTNKDIESLASSLAEGEDDSYVVVSKIARWVEENVKYDLSTTTADASQKSSWVLKNRVGVCDELTSLFISMVRSLGIPARFVSGVSYSNVNQQNGGWGPHGWAEVYFPDIGWVPFDVTYKELGFVDATHIKLKAGSDSKETSVEYSYNARGAELKAQSLIFNVNVASRGKVISPFYDVSVKLLEDEVGFGSYNLVEAQVKNTRAYYVSGQIYLSNVSELQVMGDSRGWFVLPPGTSKKFYWVVRVSEGLNDNYVYTFPVNVYGEHDAMATGSFKSHSGARVYSEEFVKSNIPEISPAKPHSSQLLASCAKNKDFVYLSEPVEIKCFLRNNAPLNLDLKVCLERNCTIEYLPSNQEREFTYSTSFKSLGVKTLSFRAESSSASKAAYVVIPVEDQPALSIFNLTFPESLSFNDPGEISFFIKRDSVSYPKNAVVRLNHELIGHEWHFKEIQGNYAVKFLLKGSDLLAGGNDFSLSVDYEDVSGKSYSYSKDFSIELVNLTLSQRLLAWMNAIDAKLSRWMAEAS